MSTLKKHKRIIGVVLGLVIAGSIMAYYTWYMGYLTPFTVRVGYLTADIHHLPLFTAIEKGWFLGKGIRFEYKPYANGPLEMMAMGVGEIDIGYVGIVPALLFKVNWNVGAVVVAASNREGSALVVDEAINSVEELDGATLATPGEQQVQYYLLSLVESQYNITINKVPIVPLTGMEPALQQKSIKGFIAWEPFPARSVRNNVGKILLTSHDIWPDHPCCVLVVSSKFLQDHSDIVESVVENHMAATDFIEENHDEAVSVGAKFTQQTTEVIQDAMNRVIFDYHPDKDGIRTVLQHLINMGWIPTPNVPANITAFLDSFINTQFLGA